MRHSLTWLVDWGIIGPDHPGAPILASIDMLTDKLLRSISLGVLIADPEGRLISVNDFFLQMTGFVREDVLGHKLTELLEQSDENAPFAASLLEAIAGGGEFRDEIRHRRKQSAGFWAELSLLPMTDHEGKLSHFIGSVRDVVALKTAEASQQEADRRYRHLIEHIPVGVVVHGPDSAIRLSNNTASMILGLSREQMIGLAAIDPHWCFIDDAGNRLSPTDYPVNRVLASGIAIRDLVVGVRRTDRATPIWAICNAYPVPAADGKIAEVVVSFAEITAIKQAEQDLQKSEERLRLVLQGSNDAPWDWNMESGDIYISPRWWDMFGYDPDDTDDPIGFARSLYHPDDLDRVLDAFHAALADGAKSYEIELRMRHKAGHYVPVLARGFILRDASGRPLRVSGTNTDLTERKGAEQQIHRLAFYDALTGLPNRRLLIEQARKALAAGKRSGRQGALLIIDLDNFKTLNDTKGHDIGDLLLQQVAQRLRDSTLGAGLVARLGGDEFVVMVEDLSQDPCEAAIETEMLGKKIILALNEPYDLMGHDYRGSPSVGVALFGAGDQGVDGLLKQADLAMYQAKAMGRNTLRFFDASMQTAVEARMSLESALRSGLQRNEIIPYYQPQIDHRGKIVGAEILLRWHHPTLGIVPPDEFIPLAETTRLILPLGQWVLRRACQQLIAWSRDPALAAMTLSVNVSVVQFREADFAGTLLALIDETGVDPKRLKLELTESLLAEDVEDVISKMTRLRARGIGFSLDDFGTGYSSLAYLQRLPLEQLKIDRCFVHDVDHNANSATIARIIITLAEKLGLGVIAEGVETETQRQFLEENGCLSYQGYLFGRPVQVESFEQLSRSQSPLIN